MLIVSIPAKSQRRFPDVAELWPPAKHTIFDTLSIGGRCTLRSSSAFNPDWKCIMLGISWIVWVGLQYIGISMVGIRKRYASLTKLLHTSNTVAKFRRLKIWSCPSWKVCSSASIFRNLSRPCQWSVKKLLIEAPHFAKKRQRWRLNWFQISWTLKVNPPTFTFSTSPLFLTFEFHQLTEQHMPIEVAWVCCTAPLNMNTSPLVSENDKVSQFIPKTLPQRYDYGLRAVERGISQTSPPIDKIRGAIMSVCDGGATCHESQQCVSSKSRPGIEPSSSPCSSWSSCSPADQGKTLLNEGASIARPKSLTIKHRLATFPVPKNKSRATLDHGPRHYFSRAKDPYAPQRVLKRRSSRLALYSWSRTSSSTLPSFAEEEEYENDDDEKPSSFGMVSHHETCTASSRSTLCCIPRSKPNRIYICPSIDRTLMHGCIPSRSIPSASSFSSTSTASTASSSSSDLTNSTATSQPTLQSRILRIDAMPKCPVRCWPTSPCLQKMGHCVRLSIVPLNRIVSEKSWAHDYILPFKVEKQVYTFFQRDKNVIRLQV